MRCITVPFLLAALAMAPTAQEPTAGVRFTRDVYPGGGSITCHGDEVWQTCRVIDGITGRPIAGAELLLIAEHSTPMRGEFWWSHRAVSDADGFVRIRTDEQAPGYERWDWTVVRAPGYGPVTHMNCVEDEICALMPAQDVPVAVRDWMDRPVGGVLLGFCGGCGHTPDLANATTDARGLAILPGINPHNHIRDLYAEHAELDLGYDCLQWSPGDPPVVFRPNPGAKSVGTVLDPDGKPVAGAFVGSKEVHRGPWTRTAADGTFRLFGSERPSDVFVVHGGREVLFARPPEQPFELRLPAPNGENVQVVELPPGAGPGEEPPEGPEAWVHLRFEFPEREKNRDVSFALIGPAPSTHMEYAEAPGGGTAQSLVIGSYEVRVAHPGYEQTSVSLVVTAPKGDTDQQLVVRPMPLPSVILRVDGLPEDGKVAVRTRGAGRDVTSQVRSGTPVWLPLREPFCFVLDGDLGQYRTFPFTMKDALTASPILLRWFRPTVVRGQLVDESGAPVSGRVGIVPAGNRVRGFDPRELETVTDAVATDGALAVPTSTTGLAFLAVVPSNGARPRVLPLSLPERGDDVQVELGDIVLRRAARLLVRGADGEPLGGAAHLMRAGWSGGTNTPPTFPLDDDGGWLGPDLRAGDAVIVPGGQQEDETGRTIADLPFRTVLEGNGPWTIDLPAGELLLDVRGEDGEPLRASALLLDQFVEAKGPTLLRRLPPGSHPIFVTAEHHQTAITAVSVPSGGPPRGDVPGRRLVLPRR